MINQTIYDILSRKSTRSFDKSRSVELEDLEAIVRCAYAAPSGMNIQPWHFTVVQDKEILYSLYTAVQEIQGRGPEYCFYNADTLIITSTAADAKFGIADCACAIENMFIAANSLGIASVWINQLSDLSTNRKFAPLMEKLDIPKTDVIRGCCALGYASDSSDSEPTQKNSEVVSWFLK